MRLIDADALMRSIDINWGCDECKARCVDVQGMALCEIHQFKECVEVEPTISQWIPVSERLPEYFEHVLVSIKKCQVEFVRVDRFGGSDNWTCYGNDVIAWMPLPDPYKESED